MEQMMVVVATETAGRRLVLNGTDSDLLMQIVIFTR